MVGTLLKHLAISQKIPNIFILNGKHALLVAHYHLLNKFVLNKLDLENLYCVVIGGQKTF